MWCTKRRMEPYQEEVKPYNISSKELKQSEFLENSPVNEFCFERLDKNGTEVVTLTSDIFMLFNQQRLDRMSKDRLLAYFENLSVNEPKMCELRSKLTDDQLCSFVKSRFIQSPSELMAWSQYLMSSQDEMIAAAAAEQQTEQPAKYEVDPTQEP
jgi:general stress protein 26